jgi:hypothetical protein
MFYEEIVCLRREHYLQFSRRFSQVAHTPQGWNERSLESGSEEDDLARHLLVYVSPRLRESHVRQD